MAALCLAAQWVVSVFGGVDERVVRSGLAALGVRGDDLNDAAVVVASNLREEAIVLAALGTFAVIASIAIWVPVAMRNRSLVLTRSTAGWAVAVAIVVSLPIFYAIVEFERVIT